MKTHITITITVFSFSEIPIHNYLTRTVLFFEAGYYNQLHFYSPEIAIDGLVARMVTPCP